MKALVLHGAGDVRTETVPDPELEPHGVIIRVRACGICGSDLHVYKKGGPEGTIFGHEFSGDVVEVGAEVQGISKGMRVTAVGFRPCGKCFWCAQGKGHRCSDMALLGYQFPGAMAEYCHVPFAVPGRTVFPLPEELSYEDGASVEPLSISYFSVNRAQPKAGESIAVIGLGVIGLNALQVLKAMGVSNVMAAGRRSARLRAAEKFGAAKVVDAAEEDTVRVLMEAVKGMGFDTVLECVGSQRTFDQSVALARGGGKVMLVGVYEEPLTWNPQSVIAKNLTLIGCLGGNFPASIDLLKSKRVQAAPLISHRFPLEQGPEAFRVQLQDPAAVKVMIVPYA